MDCSSSTRTPASPWATAALPQTRSTRVRRTAPLWTGTSCTSLGATQERLQVRSRLTATAASTCPSAAAASTAESRKLLSSAPAPAFGADFVHGASGAPFDLAGDAPSALFRAPPPARAPPGPPSPPRRRCPAVDVPNLRSRTPLHII